MFLIYKCVVASGKKSKSDHRFTYKTLREKIVPEHFPKLLMNFNYNCKIIRPMSDVQDLDGRASARLWRL